MNDTGRGAGGLDRLVSRRLGTGSLVVLAMSLALILLGGAGCARNVRGGAAGGATSAASGAAPAGEGASGRGATSGGAGRPGAAISPGAPPRGSGDGGLAQGPTKPDEADGSRPSEGGLGEQGPSAEGPEGLQIDPAELFAGCKTETALTYTTMRCERLNILYRESPIATPVALLDSLLETCTTMRPEHGILAERGELAPGQPAVVVGVFTLEDEPQLIAEGFGTALQVELTLSRATLCVVEGAERADVRRCALMSVVLLKEGPPIGLSERRNPMLEPRGGGARTGLRD